MEKKLLNEIKRMQQLAGLKPIDEKFVPIESVKLFCENKITEKEFLAELNSELLEEGIWDWIKSNIIDKVMNYFNSFLLQAYSIGWAILNKIKTFLNWLSGLVSKFAKKYPFIFKLIIIGLIILILICVFCACAKAASTGTPIPKNEINVAIGLIDDFVSRGGIQTNDPNFWKAKELVNDVIRCLVDLREGKIETLDGLSEATKTLAQKTLQRAHDLNIERSDPNLDTNSQELAKSLFSRYIEQGQNVIGYSVDKAYGSGYSKETVQILKFGEEPIKKALYK